MPPRQMPQQSQSLNNSIAQVRQMMQMVKTAENPQLMLTNILQNNPNSAYISQLLRGGNSLEGIAKMMAQQNGVDINDLIKQISVG